MPRFFPCINGMGAEINVPCNSKSKMIYRLFLGRVCGAIAGGVALCAVIGCGGPTVSTTHSRPLKFGERPLGAAQQQTVLLVADPMGKPRFTTSRRAVRTGPLSLQFVNPTHVPHNVLVRNARGRVLGMTPVITLDSLIFNLGRVQPGRYSYQSTVQGQDHMKGILIVKK